MTDSSSTSLNAQQRRRLSRRLLLWFERQRRDLPWRNSRDPYSIWVSEIMLQQTQVATVIPFYHRFLKALPNLHALAAADEQTVLKLWAGLGYYRRARHLHGAARQLVATHGGQLPDDPEVWRTLPGIGRYMLGAILSQAFDRRLPILEANTIRVLTRLFGIRESPRTPAVQKRLWQHAEELLPARQAGDFNQALMEVGALVCKPTLPACDDCPLSPWCQARRQKLQEQIPARPPAPKTIAVQEVAIVVQRGPKVLAVQRTDRGRWANMWEFPHAELQPGETHDAAAARLLPALTGVSADLGPEIATLTHAITHHAVTLVCLSSTYRSGRFRPGHYQQGLWLKPPELAELPLSAPQRRLAQLVMSAAQPRLF